MNIPGNIPNTLTDEQKKRVESAKTPEEILAVAKEIGYELSDEQLNAMSGGDWTECSEHDYCPDDVCPPVM